MTSWTGSLTREAHLDCICCCTPLRRPLYSLEAVLRYRGRQLLFICLDSRATWWDTNGHRFPMGQGYIAEAILCPRLAMCEGHEQQAGQQRFRLPKSEQAPGGTLSRPWGVNDVPRSQLLHSRNRRLQCVRVKRSLWAAPPPQS
jgi:hypothetical protein